ncbi:MAG: hypothetical protein NWF01_01470 [Candidatus Bathyarchaeota archaeon]|nr:hypothetical protein [Candidatus Bathyarchaeota archaeon]
MKLATLLLCFALLATLSPALIANAEQQTGDTWGTKTATVQQVGGLEAVAVGGQIFIFHMFSTYMYDPETDTLTNKTAMPTPRTSFAIAAVDNKIYLIGGEGLTDATNVNEVYDTQTDTWETKKPFPYTSNFADACIIGDKIYVVLNKDIQQYNPATDTWRKITTINNNDMKQKPVSVNEKIYVISNIGTLIYDTKTGGWSSGAQMPEFYSGAGVVATSGQCAPERIYVLGGYVGFVESVVNATFVYDVASDTWALAASMPTARFAFANAILNDKIYCIGGAVGWFEYTQAIDVYTPLGYGTVPSVSPSDNSHEPSPVGTTVLIVGSVVATAIVTVAAITVYHFKHTPNKTPIK